MKYSTSNILTTNKLALGLGDEFVVTNPFGITIGLFFSFARNARRKVLKVYIKADWQST